MRYFASIEEDAVPAQNKKDMTKIKSSGMSETEERILATNPVMEAFGNAKTTRNDNSSRFGKYIEILFDKKYKIIGAQMRTYLLERSRLVYQLGTERNYHIFYQLVAGAPESERKDLGLTDPMDFQYLNQGGDPVVSGVDDAHEFHATQAAMATVGLDSDRQWQVFRLLAALLHLGNIKITSIRNDALVPEDDASLFLATGLLGIHASDFRRWLVKRQIITRGEKIVSSLSPVQATAVRDSVAKYVYASVFDWLVAQMNKCLALSPDTQDVRKNMIGVLDIYGFEHFQTNSYEQFCINYANERLQHEFNDHVFKLEQEEYMAEQIQWTFIEFSDNQPTIDLIESRLGILSLLDEESRLPSGSDQSFLNKLFSQFERKPEYKSAFKKPRFGHTSFTVCHYALDVTYEVEGFLDKNKDTVPDELLALLQATSNSFLKEVFDTALTTTAVEPQPSASRRPLGLIKKPTLGSQFKQSLIGLMDTIDKTNAHYIRCIKPNEAKKAWAVEPQNMLGQLRACGVLETIRISSAGYPSRWTFAEFVQRYYMLVSSAQTNHWDTSSEQAIKDLSQAILAAVGAGPDTYQIGLTKIFFRAGMLAAFEQRRKDRLNYLTILVQKTLRARVARKQYLAIKSTTLQIQTWWRMRSAQLAFEALRRETLVLHLQSIARAFLARNQFQAVHNSITRLQAHVRGQQVRTHFRTSRLDTAAAQLQALWRGVLIRRRYAHERSGVVLLQSLTRRRLAKKEMVALKTEAKSAKHFKEISGKLENKVVELTQILQQRTRDNRSLISKVRDLETEVAAWQGKHSELDAQARGLQSELSRPSVPKEEFDALQAAKAEADAQQSQALRRVAEHERTIAELRDEAVRYVQEIEARERVIEQSAQSSEEDAQLIGGLRHDNTQLQDQLNRAQTLNSLQKTTAVPIPRSHRGAFPFQLSAGREPEPHLAEANEARGIPAPRRRGRRHSDLLLDGLDKQAHAMHLAKRDAALANRHVSMGFDSTHGVPLPSSSSSEDDGTNTEDTPIHAADDATEEVVQLLLDHEDQLEEDVLSGLIQHLRIPAPSAANAPSSKEVLFPAHLTSLVTNEMWKYGMVRESERFLASVMQTIQHHVMSFYGEEAIVPGVFWLSNVHEILSFVCIAERDMLQGMGPGIDLEGAFNHFQWGEYERLVTIVKHDLESLEYNIYQTWVQEAKKALHKMVVPAVIEYQALPAFATSETVGGKLFHRAGPGNGTAGTGTGTGAGVGSGASAGSGLTGPGSPYRIDDVLALLTRVRRCLMCYCAEPRVTQQVVGELLQLIGVTSFNDLLMRRNFCSWKRAMQIQHNITRIEEWCKANEMSEGALQLEHLVQATKLLLLKKATLGDIDIIYDVCWMLSPTQIQKLISHYYVADYENPISPEILKAVAARVAPNDRHDQLLLAGGVDEAGGYELPPPRDVTGIETYCPAYLHVPTVRRLASRVA